jgi:hypothetical protein
MKGFGGRLTTIAAFALTAFAVTASANAAVGPVHAGILGVVPHRSQAAVPVHNLMSSAAVGAATPTTLTFDSSYETLVNRYFTDVAAASGTTSNVYSVATQYSGSNGPVLYQSTFGGSYIDRDPLPVNGCDDGVDTYCLTDSQLQQEVQTAMAARGWHGDSEFNPTHIFFLMTPQGVGSCADASGSQCSTNFFCAYHSAFGTSSDAVIYANEPYEGHMAGCAVGLGFPNDVDSDTTINTISHEHNESITDPLGNGWIATDQNEDGDLCAWIFGANLGTVGGQPYNQLINGRKYDLQEEYSNADTGCIQRPGGVVSAPNTAEQLPYNGGPVIHTNTTYAIYWLPTSGNTSPPAISGTGAVNQKLTTTHGTWSDAPTGFSIRWQLCSAAGTSCANISGATAASYEVTAADAGHTLRSAVTATNVNGVSLTAATSAPTAAVVGSPVATKPPTISGKVKVGKSLTAGKGTWTGPPKTYRFQWLRCGGGGASCKAIGHATKPKYKLTQKDAKHRLRVRVTASNAVGKKTALSRATAKVPAAKS